MIGQFLVALLSVAEPYQQKLDVGPVAVEIDLPGLVFSLADPIELSVTLSTPPHIGIEGPELTPASSDFVVIDTHADGPDIVGRFALRRWRWRIEPMRLGELALPPVRFRHRSGSDPWEEASIPLPALRVVPGPSSSTDPESLRPIPLLSDATDPSGETPRSRLAARLRWAGLGLAAVGVALVLWARRRVTPSPPSSPTASPPCERALADLARIEAAMGARETDPRDAIAAGCERVRLYLEEAHGLSAPRQSTPEFLGDPAIQVRLTVSQRAALFELLTACDVRSFASPDPTADQAAVCLSRARAFLAGESAP